MSARLQTSIQALDLYENQRTRLKLLPRKLPRVAWTERRGPLLHLTPLAPDGAVLGLNLSAGCVHQCLFCSARAYASYPGEEVVNLYVASAERLDAELAGKRKLPRAVLLCPATDPFPPLAEVQAETARIIEVLAAHKVESWILTRGFIRPAVLAVIQKHLRLVKITIGLTALDRALQQLVEPLTAPPRMRVRQIARLRALGFSVQVALEPLVPGVTDEPENLTSLLGALAEIGIRHVTAGYMFVRPGIRDNITLALRALDLEDLVLMPFAGGPILRSNSVATAQYLPKTRRQRGYSRLMAIAADLGISVSVGRLSNPDFQLQAHPLADSTTRRRFLALR